VGLDDPREGAATFYDHAIARPSYGTHAVDWYLLVLHFLQVPVHDHYTWLPPAIAPAPGLNPSDYDGRQWIAINPGARWSNKRWPVEHYRTLVILLSKALPDARFAILGGKADTELGRHISSGCPEQCLDLTGKTSLSGMVDWMRRASVVITNDTGPMHVAAALGKPMVALFGPTDPRRTGPYHQLHQVMRLDLPCVPCMKAVCHHRPVEECLQEITPTQVARAVLGQLSKAD
jgi:heptosyltransferase I